MDKESIEFHFTQSKNDTSVLTAVASQIYNPLRVIIWCVFACGLFLCMLLTLSWENARYTAPILILSFLLTAAAFSMLAIIFRIRPKLLKCIQNNSQTSICIRCTQENIEICRENTLPVRVEYKNVLSQFWCGDNYILHIRICRNKIHSHELFLIPLSESTFDDIYTLASVLEKKKTRLQRIKIKSVSQK